MKILILSDANSVHTLKWVEALKKHKLKLMLFSLFKPKKDYLKKYTQLHVIVKSPDLRSKIRDLRNPNLSKLNYLVGLRNLNQTINNYQPNILHAHYASSYGMLAFLSKYKPFILSVWGSDILDFPKRNWINQFLLNKVINSANKVCSTSKVMQEAIAQNFNRSDTYIVPFGVDIDRFSPSINIPKVFTAGTIKSIEKHNGIDCLLEAAKIIIHQYNENRIKFLIVGKGSLRKDMEKKAIKLKLQDYVKFEGFVYHDDIVKYHQKLSIFIAVSTAESFGVSVLESAACGIPAITSNIGGLTEVNKHEKTGLVIKPDNPKQLADSILKLFKNQNLRIQLGKNARNRVADRFDWDENVYQMLNLYKEYQKN